MHQTRQPQGSAPLSVVVPTRDRPEMLDGCLRSLARSVRAGDEILLVDSASTSPDIRAIAAIHGVQYLRCEVPGASLARNVGWRAAKHGIVAFVDDDVRVSEHWADELRDVFEAHPEAAFVTGSVGVPEGQEDAFRPVALMIRAEPIELDRDFHGLAGHSANVAVRREALECIGGFDEILGAGGPLRASEDIDLFDRLYGMGYAGRYHAGAQAVHEQWRSRRELLKLDYSYGIGTGARFAKLIRTDRVRAFKGAKVWFWDWGLKVVPDPGDYGGMHAVARMAGALWGLARGSLLAVEDGKFKRRRAASR